MSTTESKDHPVTTTQQDRIRQVISDAANRAHRQGYAEGDDAGYARGYKAGNDEGYQQGRSAALRNLHTVGEIATMLGVSDRRVRQITTAHNIGTPTPLGKLYTDDDMEYLRERPDGRRIDGKPTRFV